MKRLFLVVAVSVACAWPVAASTFVAMTDEELVRGSAAIVEGQVLRTVSFWDETNSVIVTEATVQVREGIAGREVPGVVEVRTFGGSVGSYRVEAHGFPEFSAGDHVVLFLGDADGEAFSVTGYQLGHYQVRKDASGADLAVPTLETGVRLLSPDGAVAARPATLPLSELKVRIRAIERNNDTDRPVR